MPSEPAYPKDQARAWRGDGRQFAFQRVTGDSLGPPGLYTLDLRTLRPRYLGPATVFGPENLSYSSDGRLIVSNWFQTILFFDANTGQGTTRFYTHNAPELPHFHPTRPMIAYGRGQVFFNEDADSGSIHVFHLDSGVDSSLKAGPLPLWGSVPRWSPDGNLLTYIEGTRRVRVVNPERQEVATVFEAPDTMSVVWTRWRRSAPGRLEIIVTTEPLESAYAGAFATFVIEGDGVRWNAPRASRQLLKPLEELSPDGKWLLATGAAPGSGAAVLYLRPWESPGVVGVQLTR